MDGFGEGQIAMTEKMVICSFFVLSVICYLDEHKWVKAYLVAHKGAVLEKRPIQCDIGTPYLTLMEIEL